MAKKKRTAKPAGKASKKATKKVAKKATKKKATKKASGSKKVTKKAAPVATTKKKTTTKKTAPKTTVKKVFNDAVAKVKSVLSSVTDSMSTNSKFGTAAPAIALSATGGKQIDLSNFKGKKVVLYFYPKDDTPGCTLEGQDFTRLHKEFKAANTEVFGVSRDSVQSHDKFKAKMNYSIDLLSDGEEKLCNAYGVMKMKNMYGKQVRGIERSTFVLDGDGKIVKEWRGVSVPGHAEEVLKFVKSF